MHSDSSGTFDVYIGYMSSLHLENSSSTPRTFLCRVCMYIRLFVRETVTWRTNCGNDKLTVNNVATVLYDHPIKMYTLDIFTRSMNLPLLFKHVSEWSFTSLPVVLSRYCLTKNTQRCFLCEFVCFCFHCVLLNFCFVLFCVLLQHFTVSWCLLKLQSTRFLGATVAVIVLLYEKAPSHSYMESWMQGQ